MLVGHPKTEARPWGSTGSRALTTSVGWFSMVSAFTQESLSSTATNFPWQPISPKTSRPIFSGETEPKPKTATKLVVERLADESEKSYQSFRCFSRNVSDKKIRTQEIGTKSFLRFEQSFLLLWGPAEVDRFSVSVKLLTTTFSLQRSRMGRVGERSKGSGGNTIKGLAEKGRMTLLEQALGWVCVYNH